jgi:hypothetical protein
LAVCWLARWRQLDILVVRNVRQGVSNSGTPQQGAGTQREGLVQITRTGVNGLDIFVTGRPDLPCE